MGYGSGKSVSCEEGESRTCWTFISGQAGSRLSAFEESQTSQVALLGSSISTLGEVLADDWLATDVFFEKLRNATDKND